MALLVSLSPGLVCAGELDGVEPGSLVRVRTNDNPTWLLATYVRRDSVSIHLRELRTQTPLTVSVDEIAALERSRGKHPQLPILLVGAAFGAGYGGGVGFGDLTTMASVGIGAGIGVLLGLTIRTESWDRMVPAGDGWGSSRMRRRVRRTRRPNPMDGRRFSMSIGFAPFKYGGWSGKLSDVGYGDNNRIVGDLFGYDYSRVDTYPIEIGGAELFYVDFTVGIKPALAFGLCMNLNQPFSGATGFKATGWGIGGTEGQFLSVSPTINTLSTLLILTSPRGPVASIGLGPSLHMTKLAGSTFSYDDDSSFIGKRFSLDPVKLGFTVRVSVEIPMSVLRLGFEGQYNRVGAVDVGPGDVGDPEFPTTGFDFNYGYVGVSLGIRL